MKSNQNSEIYKEMDTHSRTTSEILNEEIIEEVKKMITFRNPNNFDEYFAKVLPGISKET